MPSQQILSDAEWIEEFQQLRALSVAVLTAVAYTNPEHGTE